ARSDPPRSNRRRRPGLHLRPRPGPDPSTPLIRLIGREDTYFAGYQKAERFYSEPDPTDVGHDRNPLAPRSMLEAKVELVPGGARKPGVELIIEPDFFVPFERLLHRRD